MYIVRSNYSLKGIFCFDTRHNFLSKIIFEYHYRVISQETMGNSALKMKVGICERLMDRWSSKKKIHEVGENFSSHLLYLHFKTNHKTQRRIFLVPKGKRDLVAHWSKSTFAKYLNFAIFDSSNFVLFYLIGPILPILSI